MRVLFEAGAGTATHFGSALFGGSVADPAGALERAGIDPSSIDAVALTHAHPDHAWGLVDEDGAAVFPRAQLIVGRRELSHWLSDDESSESNELQRLIRDGARRSILAYSDRLLVVSGSRRLLSAVTVHEAPGHSPGNVGYEVITPGTGRSLFCWGDVCHHPLVLAHPELSFVFDHDPAAAVDSRRGLLRSLAGSDTEILAYHFQFPGLGRLTGSADGGYSWVPTGA